MLWNSFFEFTLMIYLPDECHDFIVALAFFFKKAFLFIKSVKDVFVGVEFVLVTVRLCSTLFKSTTGICFLSVRDVFRRNGSHSMKSDIILIWRRSLLDCCFFFSLFF